MVSDIEQLRALDADALLRELVERYDVEPRLYSPDAFAARAREVLSKLMQSARVAICLNKEIMSTPEVELGTTLFGLLQPTLPGQLLAPFVLYVAKVGIRKICAEY